MTGGPLPQLSRLAVAGVGLIGGSIARRAQAAWPGVHVVGVDTPEIMAEALHAGVIDESCDSVDRLPDVDLVVLAAPVGTIVELIEAVAVRRLEGVVTDVGSTKRVIAEAARRHGLRRFVGGHPVAGAERGGLANARADLFEGRPWAIVAGDADADAVALVSDFAQGLGAVPRRTSAEDHDRAMAFVSHLPQLVAVALAEAARSAAGPMAPALSGRAMDEMTRLASSPPDLWADILTSNADFVGEAVSVFAGLLSRLDRGSGLPSERTSLFQHAAGWREALVLARTRTE